MKSELEQKNTTTKQPAEKLHSTPASVRHRFGLGAELALAALPTATVLAVLAFVQVLTSQRLLFASLASSAFLIYLDPSHPTNSVRTLIISQSAGALLGWAAFAALGPTYWAGGLAMTAVIVLMVTLNALHPPAVATALGFALRASDVSNLTLFAVALGLTALLVVLQQGAVRLVSLFSRRQEAKR